MAISSDASSVVIPQRAGAILPPASAPDPPPELPGIKRMQAWQWRAVIALAVAMGFAISGLWLLGLTLAVLEVIVDFIARRLRARHARRQPPGLWRGR